MQISATFADQLALQGNQSPATTPDQRLFGWPECWRTFAANVGTVISPTKLMAAQCGTDTFHRLLNMCNAAVVSRGQRVWLCAGVRRRPELMLRLIGLSSWPVSFFGKLA